MVPDADYEGQIKQADEAIAYGLTDPAAGPEHVKQAEGLLDLYVNTVILEEAFVRKEVPFTVPTPDMLSRAVDHPLPVVIGDVEGRAPMSQLVPFGTQPVRQWLRGSRWQCTFAKIQSPWISSDIYLLQTWIHDIREVIGNGCVKNMGALEDAAYTRARNTAMIAPNVVNPTTGVAQWRTFQGGVTKSNLNRTKEILLSTDAALPTAKAVTNLLTYGRLAELDLFDVGDDLVSQMATEGVTGSKWLGMEFLPTMKKALVLTNTIFVSAPTKFYARMYDLHRPQMRVKREGSYIGMGAESVTGGVIVNVAATGRADLDAA